MRLAAWLKYKVDELLARSAWGKLTLLLLFTGLVILLGMIGAGIAFFDPANTGVPGIVRTHGDWRDLLWWAARHILDPPFFYAQYGATPYIVLVSLGVSVGGLVVFSALLGLIISSLEERLEVLRRGDSDVLERGHVLILGWNSRVPEIISLLGERRQRQTVVVLAPREPRELREALRLAGVDGRKVRVILRSGMADSMTELERVAWATAAAVMIVPNETQEVSAADAAVVRTMLLLRQQPRPEGRPKIVAEIGHQAYAEAARRAGHGIPVINSAEVVARMLFQCALQRHMSTVFHEVLSPQGASLLVAPAPGCAGARFQDLVWAYPSAIPLGISRQVREPDGRITYQHTLDPPSDHRLADEEWVLLLTRGAEIPSPSPPGPDAPSSSPPPGPEAIPSGVGSPDPPEEDAPTSVLILGWSDTLVRLLQEFDRAEGPAALVTVVSGFDPETAWALLADAGFAPGRLNPLFRRLDVLLPGVLASVEPGGFDAIVALADTSWGDIDADARTLMNLVVLQPLLDEAPTRPLLVAEALHPATRKAAQGLQVDDLVIGPHVISRMLMMVSEQMMVAGVFADLLGSTGKTLALKPAAHYAPLGQPAGFAGILRQARRREEIALGVFLAPREPGAPPDLHLTPGHRGDTPTWELRQGDQVLVLTRRTRGTRRTQGTQGTQGAPRGLPFIDSPA